MNLLDEYAMARAASAVAAARRVPTQRLCGSTCQTTFEAYIWEIQISAAFAELLNHVERALRTAIDRELSTMFLQTDWWNSPNITLHAWATYEIERVTDTLVELANGRPVPMSQIPPALMFGFWVSLLSDGGGCEYENRLWRPGLRRALPKYHGSRKDAYRRLNYLRMLRNQIAHPDDSAMGARDLAADHRSIYIVYNWLSPELAAAVQEVDRVPALLATRPEKCGGCPPLPRQRTNSL